MSNIAALIARLEKATGPDYRLSQDIGEAINLPGHYRYEHPGSENQSWKNYTASLDAAMTLVPEGVSFAVGKGIETELGGSATDYAWCGSKAVPHEGPYAWAATPALALCAAALRARAKGVSR